mgnify:CR=1 FL=1
MTFWKKMDKLAFAKALLIHLVLVGVVLFSFHSSESVVKPKPVPQHIMAVVVEKPKPKPKVKKKAIVKKKTVKKKVKKKKKKILPDSELIMNEKNEINNISKKIVYDFCFTMRKHFN